MIINYVPVENVKFIVSHSVQHCKNNSKWFEVTRGVNQQPSVSKSGTIGDSGTINDELRERLNTPNGIIIVVLTESCSTYINCEKVSKPRSTPQMVDAERVAPCASTTKVSETTTLKLDYQILLLTIFGIPFLGINVFAFAPCF